jgi:hypothetical protein
MWVLSPMGACIHDKLLSPAPHRRLTEAAKVEQAAVNQPYVTSDLGHAPASVTSHPASCQWQLTLHLS